MVIFTDGILQRIVCENFRVSVASKPCKYQRSVRVWCKPVPHAERCVIDTSVLYSLDRGEIGSLYLIFQHVLRSKTDESRTVDKQNIRIPLIDLFHAYLCKTGCLRGNIRDA